MKELKLIDRVVVEIKSEEEAECMASCIANHLRIVAEQIKNGMKGDNYVFERPSNGQRMEVLWEHECPNYGGFRMGNRSLICQYYYHSEAQPIIIDSETIAKVVEWRKMFKEKDENNEYKYSDCDLVDDAYDILKSIVEQWKEQSK